MNRVLALLLLATSAPRLLWAQDAAIQEGRPAVAYGSNPAAGNTFTHDGVELYYEVYGTGEPVLLVHGNGLSIGSLGAQIDNFRENYMVIAMDSRDQGRSGDSPGPLTFEQMTDDLAALIDHLGIGPVNVLGWSDGGIEGLLLGIRHPSKVKKIAAMAANLNSSEYAFYPEAIDLIESSVDAASQAADTPEGRRAFKVASIMLDQPNIEPNALEAITAPTLVLAGDHDVIRDEHTLEIFHHIPNGQLAILPNSTHMVPFDDPELFNATVERFFRTPYVKKDRIKDVLRSFAEMESAATHQ